MMVVGEVGISMGVGVMVVGEVGKSVCCNSDDCR